jgi:iron complex outermembrane receptor protein
MKKAKDFNVISALKLRGGWGITGQQDGVSYPSIPLYLISNTAQYQFGNVFIILSDHSLTIVI